MKRVLLTGAIGTIGRILREDLGDRYAFIATSRRPGPGLHAIDLAGDYAELRELAGRVDAIVHLAYVEEERETAANHLMAKNICEAALAARPTPRLILASSIHAAGGAPPPTTGKALMTDLPATPNGLYGALKVYIESLGRFCASKGLEAVVLRLGGVRVDDAFPPEEGYRRFWLSRRDCARAFACALEAELPEPYVCAYIISKNEGRHHDLSWARQALGFEPIDGAEIGQNGASIVE